jgi:2-polyprenyl-3-methyl-5-hydroxy-6-metoxy-1,4-benzoquinol methylase
MQRGEEMRFSAVQKRIERYAQSLSRPTPPHHLSKNFREIDEPSCNRLEQSLVQNYFEKQRAARGEDYLSTEVGRNDLLDHLYRRTASDRLLVVPWLDQAKPLKGSDILEIGCGTGASTVALAEQGARVTAVDVENDSLAVAQERCEIYGVEARVVEANATMVRELFPGEHFDFIIFYASLEHMIHGERIAAMRDTWQMLTRGDLWCVVEAPNRLWYYDGHTSLLPFFMWLPDNLAFEYSQFSPRTSFSHAYRDMDEASMQDFLRSGRGVSFHEFELAMAPIEELDIISDLASYRRKKSIIYWLYWQKNYARYSSFLSKAHKKASKGFNEKSLDIIIRKERS